jgi:hypothetical protein
MAVDDVDMARSLLQDSPLMLTIVLSVLTEGIELAKYQESSTDAKQWRERGEEIVKKLELRPDCFMGKREMTVYWHVTGQVGRRALTEQELVDRGIGGWIVETSVKLRTGDTAGLERRLRQEAAHGEAQVCLARILAERSEEGRDEALRIFHRLQQADVEPATRVLSLGIPLLLGKPEEARRASEQLLESNAFAKEWREWKCMAEFHAGRTHDDELERSAGPFGVMRQAFLHQIALEALAVGNRKRAREYFAATVATGQIGTWNYHSALAYLARLDADKTWPSWIKQVEH